MHRRQYVSAHQLYVLQHRPLGHQRIEQAQADLGEAELGVHRDLLDTLLRVAQYEGVVDECLQAAGDLVGQLSVGALQAVAAVYLVLLLDTLAALSRASSRLPAQKNSRTTTISSGTGWPCSASVSR